MRIPVWSAAACMALLSNVSPVRAQDGTQINAGEGSINTGSPIGIPGGSAGAASGLQFPQMSQSIKTDTPLKAGIFATPDTMVIRRDAPPSAGSAMRALPQAGSLNVLPAGNLPGSAEKKALNDAPSQNMIQQQTTGRSAGSAAFEETRAEGVKSLEVDVKALEKAGVPGSDDAASSFWHRLFDLDARRRGFSAEPNMAANLPELKSLGPAQWVKRIEQVAANSEVDSRDKPLIWAAAIVKIAVFVKQGQINPKQAAKMIAEIRADARVRGIKEDGVLHLARATFLSAAAGDQAAAGKGEAALELWDSLLARSDRPFIKGLAIVKKQIDGVLRDALAALSHQGALPVAPIVGQKIIGGGAQVQVALVVQMVEAMPTEVRPVPESLRADFAIKGAEEMIGEAAATPDSLSDAIMKSGMPIGFGATVRNFRSLLSDKQNFWTSFKMTFGRWARGEKDSLWAIFRKFLDVPLGWIGIGPRADSGPGIRVFAPQPA